jgi:hypothetical protein
LIFWPIFSFSAPGSASLLSFMAYTSSIMQRNWVKKKVPVRNLLYSLRKRQEKSKREPSPQVGSVK